jgi:hypothetical protein
MSAYLHEQIYTCNNLIFFARQLVCSLLIYIVSNWKNEISLVNETSFFSSLPPFLQAQGVSGYSLRLFFIYILIFLLISF